jgi:hypothetical protein
LLLGAAACSVSASPEPASTEAAGVGQTKDSLILPFPPDGGCPGVGLVFCINGGHWDPSTCECVPPAGAQCATDFDCPQLGLACEQCAADTFVCPSDRCIDGRCVLSVPLCPTPRAPAPAGTAAPVGNAAPAGNAAPVGNAGHGSAKPASAATRPSYPDNYCSLFPSACNCTFPPCPWEQLP